MKRSKRIEALDARPVNLDGYINEWPEMGFIAMNSPYDPKPSVKVEDGRIVELDGKTRDEFDFIDQFIADYAINVDRAAASMAVPSLEIARKIVDIHVSRKEILDLVAGITPAKMAEVLNQLNRPGTDRRRRRRRRTEGILRGRDDHGCGKIRALKLHGSSDRLPDRTSGCAHPVFRGGSHRT